MLFLSSIVIAVAIVTKLLGCGLPAMIFLRNKSKAMKVGIGMISRGEVGLIVAGIGVSSGALSSNIYTAVIIMVAITTLITPLWLKKAYSKEQTVAMLTRLCVRCTRIVEGLTLPKLSASFHTIYPVTLFCIKNSNYNLQSIRFNLSLSHGIT